MSSILNQIPLEMRYWINVFGLILCGLIISKITRLYLHSALFRMFKAAKLEYKEKQETAFLRPLGMTLFFTTIYIGVRYTQIPESFIKIVMRLTNIGLAVSATWASIYLIDIVALFFEKKAAQTEAKFDDILIPLVATGTKLFMFAIGIVFIGHSLTINVTNIIAGLGIGGLAFALAAKDTLSNLFGSLTVILDRPFEIGDWVTIGSNVEGIVEGVGFRSTRIRTFYNSQITIPNNQLTNIHVDNYGRREFRRFTTKLGIQYDTPPEKIEAFCEGVRQLILTQPNTRKDYFNVYLTELADSSLNIMIYVFFKVDDWTQELTDKHRLLVDILRLAKEIGVEFAFPTTTVHLFNEQKAELSNIESKFHETGQEKARYIAKKPISPKSPRSCAPSGELPPIE